MHQIHPSSVVDPRAKIGQETSVGPFCVIEANVEIGTGCRIGSHVVIKSGTTIGNGNYVEEGAVLGGRPQHLKAGNECGRLWIGDRNQIREQVTIHTGLGISDETRIGDDNMIMVNSHIAHDSAIGNHCVIVNNVMIAGHVTIEDYAYLGGASAVHQFCRVGSSAMVGGFSRALKDVPPYTMVCGDTSRVTGINRVGLRRRGFEAGAIQEIKEAYQLLYRSDLTWQDALDEIESRFDSRQALHFAAFLRQCKRGWLPERRTKTPGVQTTQDQDSEFPRLRVA